MEEILDTQKIIDDPEGIKKAPTTQLSRGTVLVERYVIQEVLGIGGMGAVYRARDLHFPNVVKNVAVKEMINQARDPILKQTIIQNFEREAHILVTLSHVCIPKIFDFFTFHDRSYLVLEYVHGKDLEALLTDSSSFFPEDQVIGWAIELCDVLAFLHNHKPEPIIFRDIKPSNIMINQDGHVVLVDFGIAKLFHEGQKGTMIGTEGYSPPEQYRGEATPRADIYSLGATLHHLLTRRDPRLETPFTFLERPIRKINPAISPELEAIVNTALQYNPGDRYQSSEKMREALQKFNRRSSKPISVSSTATPTILDEKIKPLWTFKCEDELRGSPVFDNNTIYVGSYDNNLYSINASNGQFNWKYPSEAGIVSKPALAEGCVFFGSEDARLYSILIRTGKLAWTYPTGGPVRSSPRIAEGHVFIGSDDGNLHAVNIASGRATWRVETASPIRSTPFVTNENVIFGNEEGELACVDFRGAVRWRFQAKRAITSSPLVSQGVVFFGSLDGTVYALDAKSGWSIWRFRMTKGTVSSPAQTGTMVFIGSADTNIYCIDTTNAKEIWRFKTDHQVSGSPVVNKDAVYCGSVDGLLYCLDIRTGKERWHFETGGPITGVPIVNNDIIYFGSHDQNLYALLV